MKKKLWKYLDHPKIFSAWIVQCPWTYSSTFIFPSKMKLYHIKNISYENIFPHLRNFAQQHTSIYLLKIYLDIWKLNDKISRNITVWLPTTKIIPFRSQKLFLTSIPAAFMGELIFIGMLQDSFLTGLPRSSENLILGQVRILYNIWVSSNLALDLVLKCVVIFGVDQLEKTSNLAMFGRFWYCSRFSLHEICFFCRIWPDRMADGQTLYWRFT